MGNIDRIETVLEDYKNWHKDSSLNKLIQKSKISPSILDDIQNEVITDLGDDVKEKLKNGLVQMKRNLNLRLDLMLVTLS